MRQKHSNTHRTTRHVASDCRPRRFVPGTLADTYAGHGDNLSGKIGALSDRQHLISGLGSILSLAAWCSDGQPARVRLLNYGPAQPL